MKRLLIVGGDMRFIHLAEYFAAENTVVSVCGFNDTIKFSSGIEKEKNLDEAVQKADVVVLPLPASKDKITINTPLYDGHMYLNDIFLNANPDTLICLGKYDTSVFESHNLKAVDYSLREDFAYLNAIPTAEGAIRAAMNEIDTTIFSSRILICGFGRCSKILALTLKAMGADVCICARSLKDISFAKALAFKTVHMSNLEESVNRFDIIFNTVPSNIFTEQILNKIKKTTPLIDIASAPGGTDSKQAAIKKIKYLFLPGLPGIYSPQSAGQIIKETVVNIVNEHRKDA